MAISRILSWMIIYLAPLARRARPVRAPDATITREFWISPRRAGGPSPCSVLHRMGFFVPRSLRAGRWAFTPPFHPYPPIADFGLRKPAELAIQALSAIRIPKSAIERRFVFCDTFRRPRLSPRVPACFTRHVALWCSDFPLPCRTDRGSDHLPSARNVTRGAARGRGKFARRCRAGASPAHRRQPAAALKKRRHLERSGGFA